jgi:hypothetical protein
LFDIRGNKCRGFSKKGGISIVTIAEDPYVVANKGWSVVKRAHHGRGDAEGSKQ